MLRTVLSWSSSATGSVPGPPRRRFVAAAVALTAAVLPPLATAVPASAAPAPQLAVAAAAGPTLGFDATSAPDLGLMRSWMDASPYRTVGVYLPVAAGTDNRSDKVQANLTSSWVTDVRAMGWRIAPVYLGLQAPDACSSGNFWHMAGDPGTAGQQGAQAASSAAVSAGRLGIEPGSPLYADIESYSPGCSDAVVAFVSGWSSQLTALGYVPGVYGSRSSLMTDLTNAVGRAGVTLPAALWIGTGNGQQSVFGLGTPPDQYWANQQRTNQYALNVTESYGGRSLNIDANAVDGPVVPARSAQATPTGTFRALTPSRIVDSRVGLGLAGKVAPYQAPAVTIAGRGGIPASGVSAVVLNVTVTEPQAPGDLAVYPTGVARPAVSNVNFSAGQSVPNLVTVPVGTDGRIVMANNSTGSSHVVVDVAGYYLSGSAVPGAFASVTPTRIADSRVGIGAAGAFAPFQATPVQVNGVGGVPTSGVAAVVVNVTVTQPTAPGNLIVYPSGAAQPVVSNVNFVAGQSVPDLVTVPVGADGRIVVANNSTGSSQVLVDVAGYYLAGTPTARGTFTAVAPSRVVDSRSGTGLTGPLGSYQGAPVRLTGVGGIPSSGASAVVATVTVTQPTAPGDVSVYPTGVGRPGVSNVNFVAGQSVPNLVAVPVGADGRVTVFNNSTGSSQVIVDVAGWFR